MRKQHVGERKHGGTRRGRRHAHDPATAPAIAEEAAHAGVQQAAHVGARGCIAGEPDLAAEHPLELAQAFDCHGQVNRAGGGETDEERDVHARQRFAQARARQLEANARQATL